METPFKVFVFLIMALAWASLLWRTGTALRVLLFVAFGFTGALMTVFGAFAYYWDSNMRPDHRSTFLLVCGILTLLSQTGNFVKAVFDDETRP